MQDAIPDPRLAAWYAAASGALADFTGLSLPAPTDRLRQAPTVHNPALGIDHAHGAAFYPSCGRDTAELRRFFARVCNPIILADPFHRRPRTAPPPYWSGRQIDHIGHVVKMADVPAPVPAAPFTHHADDGLATLCRAVDDLAVFYYRGDSQGEGGSGQFWLGAVLFQAVIFSLPEHGLIVTDGSNCMLPGGSCTDQQLPWSALAGARCGQPPRIGDRIRWRHVVLECVHESPPAGRRARGTFAWRVRSAVGHRGCRVEPVVGPPAGPSGEEVPARGARVRWRGW